MIVEDAQNQEDEIFDINCMDIYRNRNLAQDIETESESEKNDDLFSTELIPRRNIQPVFLDNYGPPNKYNIRFLKGLSLRDFQLKAIDWMLETDLKTNDLGIQGGIISLDVGLGKSIVSIAYILARNRSCPSLIVCPKSLVYHWVEQIEKFFGDVRYSSHGFKYMIISSGDSMRPFLTHTELSGYKLVITTYSRLTSMVKQLGLLKVVKKPDAINEQFNEQTNDFTNNINTYDEEEFNQAKRKRIKYEIDQTKFIQTEEEVKNSYGKNLFMNFNWESIICDESHCIRNKNSTTFKTVLCLKGKTKWCFTGTPIRNYCDDLISQFNFLGYNDALTKSNFKMKFPEVKEYIYYRSHVDCNVILPPIVYKNEQIELSEMERKYYRLNLDYIQNTYGDLMEAGDFHGILNMIMRLRQICISSYLTVNHQKIFSEELTGDILLNLFKETKKKKSTKKLSLDDKISIIIKEDPVLKRWLYDINNSSGLGSAKIKRTLEIITTQIPREEKVVVFSMFKKVNKLFSKALEENHPEIKYLMFNGDISHEERNNMIKNFRNDPLYKIMFVTYQTGSEGLNIFEANNVILLEGWWNYCLDQQAIGRLHRIGQENQVKVWKLIVKDSIEERMEFICISKKFDADFYVKNKQNSSEREFFFKILLSDDGLDDFKLHFANIGDYPH